MDVSMVVSIVLVLCLCVAAIWFASYFFLVPWWACVLFLMLFINISISLDAVSEIRKLNNKKPS